MTRIGEWIPCAFGPYFLTRFLGTFVQYFGVVMLAPQTRVVPLTPLLPFVTPIDDERSRQRHFMLIPCSAHPHGREDTSILRNGTRTTYIFPAPSTAPEPLGSERPPRGWFALATKKVDIVALRTMKSFPELDTWKENICQLVDGFNRGDLRSANFLFTKLDTSRFLLNGGEKKQVYFSCGLFVEELRVQHNQHDSLNRPITREDDGRVPSGVFR